VIQLIVNAEGKTLDIEFVGGNVLEDRTEGKGFFQDKG
jgi:hypothetical protein